MVGVMAVMVNSFKRAYASTPRLPGLLYSVPLTPRQATVSPHLCWRLLDTHRQVWLSLFWGHCSFFLSPGAHKVLFVPSQSLFPQSCGSSIIKTHWPSKSNSLGGSQSLCQIPGLGNLLWSLELPQQCKHFFCIIVLQFVGCLFSGSMVGLTCHASHVCCTQSPCPPWQATGDLRLHRTHSNTKGRSRSVSCGVLVHTRNFVRL